MSTVTCNWKRFIIKSIRREKDKTYIWLSVWWKTKTWRWWIYMPHIHWVVNWHERFFVWKVVVYLQLNKKRAKTEGIKKSLWKWLLSLALALLIHNKHKTLNIILEHVVFYESIKRKLKTKYICGCRCYERLQPNTKKFTCLAYTELVLELEHLKIEWLFYTVRYCVHKTFSK